MFTEKQLKAQILKAAEMIDASEKADERSINKVAWTLYRRLVKMEQKGDYDAIHED